MIAMVGRAVVIFIAAATLSACESLQEPAGLDSQFHSIQSESELSVSRRDNPWFRMTDAELASAVSDVDGYAVVGFREHGASDGVSERGDILVSRATVSAGIETLQLLGVQVIFQFELLPTVYVRIPDGALPAIRQLPIVDYVEPGVSGSYLAQDTTWNVRAIGAPTVWSSATGSPYKVLIVDSGAGMGHPDLNYPVAADCGNHGTVEDSFGHGTFVAGIVGALNNQAHIIGAAWGAEIWSGKDGTSAPITAFTAACIAWGAANVTHGVFAINVSSAHTPNTAMTDAIRQAYNNSGQLVVVPVGEGTSVRYPANMPEVIAVTALDSNNHRWAPAATGPEVELAAPGVAVLSTALPAQAINCPTVTTYVRSCTGTSFAAPHVAAAAVMVKSYYPSWTNLQVRNWLNSTATDLGPVGRDSQFGFGLVNLAAAIPW
jgi:subtilisin family serine protease